MKLSDFLNQAEARLNQLFNHYLVELSQPAPQLQQAIAYSALNGGKRVRPLLVYLTGHAFNAPLENLDSAAIAIELIHVYSLIHDDLPSMDNSDLRRGKPTCHIVFGDAIAILAGDALQPLAFKIIASHPAKLNPEQRLAMIDILSETSGINGMAAGQTLDLMGVATLDALTAMYKLKTGALLAASVKLGAVSAHIQEEKTLAALSHFAECLGLAFQIQDDLLDIEGSSQITGKPKGLDSANQKMTYPLFIGVEQSRKKVHELFATALSSIEFLDTQGQLLRQFAEHLLQRQR